MSAALRQEDASIRPVPDRCFRQVCRMAPPKKLPLKISLNCIKRTAHMQASSIAGQCDGLQIRRSWVQILPGLPTKPPQGCGGKLQPFFLRDSQDRVVLNLITSYSGATLRRREKQLHPGAAAFGTTLRAFAVFAPGDASGAARRLGVGAAPGVHLDAESVAF